MYLWVHLILDLVGNASSLLDLQQQVDELPSTLKEVYARILNNVKSRCSINDFSKIRRLFAWLMCNRGKQPLSRPVARLGMFLDSSCTTISRETNTFVNATDICKPFIEEGPGNSLVFVHSTVPQFLLDRDSGPFLSQPECEQSVTIGCLTQLRQSLELLNPTTPGNKFEIAVAKGSYALLPYANQYWPTHLRSCVELQHEMLPGLASQIEALSDSISLLGQNSDETTVADCSKPMKGDSILARYLSPKALELVTQYEREPEGGKNHELLHPLLTQATKRYHVLLRSLVVRKEVQGLDISDLLRFQEDFGSNAFMCLSVGCEKSVSGFSCQVELDNHESSHSQPFRCINGCAFDDVGFTTIQQLRNHIRKRHPASIKAPVPKRLRRSNIDAPTGMDTQEDTNEEMNAELPTGDPPILTHIQHASHTREEAVERLKQIGAEEQRAYNNEHIQGIIMNTEEHADMTAKIQRVLLDMSKIGRALGRWYHWTHDDDRARMFFRMRMRCVRQFSDWGKATTPMTTFTMKPEDLDQCRALLESIAKDLKEELVYLGLWKQKEVLS
ncbi:hypothetical protein PG999_010377 [Apiospora kogelbergensis]|uniref:C2H2-type domain-containing protein n=1 Tax=Apiospora kogelbergensis TaxID=1337665 RepID=A0AAW0QRA4_9PEZI